MALTPETLPRHELVGLHVRVVESTDPGRVGIEGRVVRETAGTLVVSTASGAGVSTKQVPKRGTTFEFALPAGDATTDEAAERREASGTASKLPSETAGRPSGQSGGCEDVAYVTVDGEVLLSRPARRTEQGVDSTWR